MVIYLLGAAVLKDVVAAQRVAHDLDDRSAKVAPLPQGGVRVSVALELAEHAVPAYLVLVEASTYHELLVWGPRLRDDDGRER